MTTAILDGRWMVLRGRRPSLAAAAVAALSMLAPFANDGAHLTCRWRRNGEGRLTCHWRHDRAHDPPVG